MDNLIKSLDTFLSVDSAESCVLCFLFLLFLFFLRLLVLLLADVSEDPEEDEELSKPLTDPQLTVATPLGVAPPLLSEAVATPSGASSRPIGARAGLENYDLTEGVGIDDRHSSDPTSVRPGDA